MNQKNPETLDLPAQVVRAWGFETALVFQHWLENKLLTTQLTSKVEITAAHARRKVNVLMLDQVSNLLLANDPTFIQTAAGKWVWRVPVDLTYPKYGRVGKVGEVDVDAHSGMIDYDRHLLEEISKTAIALAQVTLQNEPSAAT